MIKAANNRAEEGREIRVKQRHEREEARRQAFITHDKTDAAIL